MSNKNDQNTDIKNDRKPVSKPTKNIVILAMSTLSGKTIDDEAGNKIIVAFNDTWKFTYKGMSNPDGEGYFSTLEPISRMIKEREGSLDYVVILATEGTQRSVKIKRSLVHPYNQDTGKSESESDEIVEISAVDFYKTRLGLVGSSTRVDIAPYEESDEKTLKKAIHDVITYVRNYWQENEAEYTVNLWVDTQGGPRASVLVLNAIVSLLKNENIMPKDIYYIDITSTNDKQNEKPKPKEIKSVLPTYQIFDFVSGMNEFTNTGRGDQLDKYYKKVYGKTPKDLQQNKPKIITTMRDISQNITMCNISEFDENIKKLKDSLDDSKGIDPLLDIFMENIAKDYGSIATEEADKYSKIDVIKWFFDKKLYQPTLTYIESKLPGWWHDKGFFTYEDLDEEEANKTKDVRDSVDNLVIKSFIQYICKDSNRESSNNDGYAQKVKKIKKNVPIYYAKVKELRNGSSKIPVYSLKENEQGERPVLCQLEFNVGEDKDELFFECIYIYYVLKEKRNAFNHMSKNIPSFEDLTGMIDHFIKRCEELEAK